MELRAARILVAEAIGTFALVFAARRSIGPAIASGNFHALWLYIVAPLIGAAIGGLAYQFVRGEQTRPGPIEAPK
jgi:glycerol uptake facilitator-like aquaporin